MIADGGAFGAIHLAVVSLCLLSVSSSSTHAVPDHVIAASASASTMEDNLKRLMRREQQGKLDLKFGEEDDGVTEAFKDHSETQASMASHGGPTAEWKGNGDGQNNVAASTWATAPTDSRLGKIKDGFCSNWLEGSSVRTNGESSSYWGSSNQLTEGQCFDNCDLDKACEQAVYQASTQECWLGINAMTQDPGPMACDGCVNTCYAKNGFGHQLNISVKDGWCSNFAEGWGGAAPQQCDLMANTVDSQSQCSHWGAEYDLSERGCWVKCQENPKCTQAIYENKEGSWGCFIGTGVMNSVPGPSRCADCNNRCYAPNGFP